jgi:ribonuclease HI
MVHPIDEKLQKLDPPLTAEESLEIYIYGTHKKVSSGRFIHAFGVTYRRSLSKPSWVSKYVSDKSDEGEDTDSSRAVLGALLTAMRWLEISEAQSHSVTIYNDVEYITKWLPANIEEWCGNAPLRPNRDLLETLLPYFKEGEWPLCKIAQPDEGKSKKPMLNEFETVPADFKSTFSIANDIPMSEEDLRLMWLDHLKEEVEDHLKEYIDTHRA